MTLAPRQAGHLAMLAFSALVAGSFSLGAMAAPLIDPAALTVPRFALAGALVGAAAVASGKIDRKALAAPWRYVVLGGLLAIYFVLMFEGLKTAAPVSAAAVFTLTPLMAAGFGWVVLRQKVTARMALALTIGAATPGRVRSQASETCAGVASLRSATALSVARIRTPRSSK